MPCGRTMRASRAVILRLANRVDMLPLLNKAVSTPLTKEIPDRFVKHPKRVRWCIPLNAYSKWAEAVFRPSVLPANAFYRIVRC